MAKLAAAARSVVACNIFFGVISNYHIIRVRFDGNPYPDAFLFVTIL
jgi:hypothetical protein